MWSSLMTLGSAHEEINVLTRPNMAAVKNHLLEIYILVHTQIANMPYMHL